MKQEYKELLLKDLCARLPYKVIIKSVGENKIIGLCDLKDIDNLPIPYLRQMSSMTEEEAEEFRLDFHYNFYIGYGYSLNNKDGSYMMPMFVMRDYFDWLNAHHFDYRGLIENGLALEATEGMYEI